MAAKDSLLATLAILQNCLTDPALINKAPADIAHNRRANMLRQGLAVLAFSTVETFVRERTGEVLQSFTNKKLTFAELSSPLQRAVTMGALEGVRFRLKLQPAPDKITWLVGKLAPIAGATKDVSKLSDHAFGYATSNLDEEDVKDILKAFGVENPWTQLTQLTARVGLALLNSESEFESIKKRRHSSAHALAAQVPHTDLRDSVRSCLAICLAFDLLLSHAARLCNLRLQPGLSGRPLLSHADIKLVFVAPRPGTPKFGVRKEQLPPPIPVLRRPTIRTFMDGPTAAAYGSQYAKKRRTQLVVLDATSTPTSWETW